MITELSKEGFRKLGVDENNRVEVIDNPRWYLSKREEWT